MIARGRQVFPELIGQDVIDGQSRSTIQRLLYEARQTLARVILNPASRWTRVWRRSRSRQLGLTSE